MPFNKQFIDRPTSISCRTELVPPRNERNRDYFDVAEKGVLFPDLYDAGFRPLLWTGCVRCRPWQGFSSVENVGEQRSFGSTANAIMAFAR